MARRSKALDLNLNKNRTLDICDSGILPIIAWGKNVKDESFLQKRKN